MRNSRRRIDTKSQQSGALSATFSLLKATLLSHKTEVVLACIIAVTALIVCNKMNNDGITQALWKQKKIRHIIPEIGYCYQAKLKDDSLSAMKKPSVAVVLENGKPLGPGNAQHADIRSKGEGLFSFWGDYVLFSSSDGSDPRSNGRKYEIRYPMHFSAVGNTALFAALFLFVYTVLRLTGAFLYSQLLSLRNELLVHKTRVVLACMVAGAVLIVCNRANTDGVTQVLWKQKEIKYIAHENGRCYQANLRDDLMSGTTGPSVAVVLENGKPLGPGNAQHADIRSKGEGLFSFWGDNVLFSSSDGSDPRSNGRKYEVRYPVHISAVENTFFFMLLFILIYLVFSGIRWLFPPATTQKIGAFLTNHQSSTNLTVSFCIIILSNVITKLPYYTYYPMASVQPDSGGYLQIAHQIASGVLPDLHYRTIGYPLMILAATRVSDTFFSIITMQILISIAACLTLTYALHQRNKWLSLITAISLSISGMGDMELISSFAVLTESLYTSCLIFSLAFLALAMQKRNNIYFLVSSLFIGYAIYVRPTGYFIFPIIALTLIFLWRNKYSLTNMVSLITPCVLMILMVMFYNQRTYGKFTFTEGGAYTFTITAGSFLEQDPSYPKEWNAAIAEVQKWIDPKDRQVVFSSWNMEQFYASYHKYFNCSSVWGPLSEVSPKDLVKRNNIFKKIGLDSVRKHLGLYMKIVYFNARLLFTKGILQPMDYFEHLRNIAEFALIRNEFVGTLPESQQKIYMKEYFGITSLPHSKIRLDFENKRATIDPSLPRTICSTFMGLQADVFRNMFWVYAPFVILLISAIGVFKTRLLDFDIFFLLVLSLFYFGNSSLCALFSNDLRFITVVVFANHLSFFLTFVYLVNHYINVHSEGAFYRKLLKPLRNIQKLQRNPGGSM